MQPHLRPCALLLLALLLNVTSAQVPRTADPDACFERRQRCCFKYAFCGWAKRRTESSATCTVKRCGRPCERLCSGRPSCLAACNTSACFRFPGTCRVRKMYRYPRFCPRIECQRARIVFDAGKHKPPVFVDSTQEEVVNSTRTDTVTR